ncbi:hypothetical protein L5515_007714 [Caenorhabditis briggsae]|uniref:Uncharacterized protein n=1 Tax=Caenorhabditis briggsae TaxID=6238 RepID=A0AAE9F5X0_CAEBR|nr:hypothetical protein L5515_007714 [Caenorhabditis briggsae]
MESPTEVVLDYSNPLNATVAFLTLVLILVLIYLVRIVIVIFETYDQLKVNCYTSFLLVALAWRYDFQAHNSLRSNSRFIMIMFNEKLSLLRKRLLPTPSATHLAQKTFTVSVVSRLPEIN